MRARDDRTREWLPIGHVDSYDPLTLTKLKDGCRACGFGYLASACCRYCALSEPSSGRQAVNVPTAVRLEVVLEAVVEAVGAAVPELEAIGVEAVAAPEGR